jgi:hypothetical protein
MTPEINSVEKVRMPVTIHSIPMGKPKINKKKRKKRKKRKKKKEKSNGRPFQGIFKYA